MRHRCRTSWRALTTAVAAWLLAFGVSAQAQDEPHVGGTRTVGDHNSLQVLDVMGSTATRDEICPFVFKPLVTMDRGLEPAPFLADSWEVSDDGLRWTFLAIAYPRGPRSERKNVIWALTITQTPSTARIVRATLLLVKEHVRVSAAQSWGARDLWMLLRHVIPNSRAPLILQSTFILGVTILSEAGLSFVGAGTQPPTPNWGDMLSDAKRYLYIASWMSDFPAVFRMLAVLGPNRLGDGLRDAFDPRMRGT